MVEQIIIPNTGTAYGVYDWPLLWDDIRWPIGLYRVYAGVFTP